MIMRFYDLFISYKIGLKNLKSTMPYTKLPRYRKIFVVTLFICAVISVITWILKWNMMSLIFVILIVVLGSVFGIVDSQNKNLKIMLNEHYIPYSEERMQMVIGVLEHYKIDIKDSTIIDMLIEEAERVRIQSDYLAPLKKPLKTLSAIIIPIVAYAVKNISDTMTEDKIMEMSILSIVVIIQAFALMFAFEPLLRALLYRDYDIYGEFIDDLKQIKIFYSQKDRKTK